MQIDHLIKLVGLPLLALNVEAPIICGNKIVYESNCSAIYSYSSPSIKEPNLAYIDTTGIYPPLVFEDLYDVNPIDYMTKINPEKSYILSGRIISITKGDFKPTDIEYFI